MAKSITKKKEHPLTHRQKVALKHLVENRGTAADALRAAGYGPSTVKNPDRVTKSVAFSEALEAAGLTDELIAKKYSRLLNSSRLETQRFDMWKINGRWQCYKPEEIKRMMEGVEGYQTGVEVIHMQKDMKARQLVVLYRHPDNVVQRAMLELAGKVKSHFAPDKLDLVDHTLSDEDRAKLAKIYSANKK